MHLGISGTLKHITHDSMMMILMSFLTLAATALTAPSLHIREDLRYVRVTVQQHKITSKQIVVRDSSTEISSALPAQMS